MKKILWIITCIFLFPLTTIAKTPLKEDVMDVIGQIENIQLVEDGSISIQNTTVDDNTITLNMIEYGLEKTVQIPYRWKDNILTFEKEISLIELDLDKSIKNITMDETQYAFYLYSILESYSMVPYEEKTYYTPTRIYQILNNNTTYQTILEKKEYQEQDSYQTFGLTLVGETLDETHMKVRIQYNYYLETDYPVTEKFEKKDNLEESIKNPNTGNYTKLTTIMFLFVIGIAVYTALDDPKKKKGIRG